MLSLPANQQHADVADHHPPATDTMAAHNSGKLKELFAGAGVAVNNV